MLFAQVIPGRMTCIVDSENQQNWRIDLAKQRFSYEKRQRELEKKKKKEQKLQRKIEKKKITEDSATKDNEEQ